MITSISFLVGLLLGMGIAGLGMAFGRRIAAIDDSVAVDEVDVVTLIDEMQQELHQRAIRVAHLEEQLAAARSRGE